MNVIPLSRAQRLRQQVRSADGRYAPTTHLEAELELDGADLEQERVRDEVLERLGLSLDDVPGLEQAWRDRFGDDPDLEQLEMIRDGRLSPWSVLSDEDPKDLVVSPHPGSAHRDAALAARRRIEDNRALARNMAYGLPVSDSSFELMRLDAHEVPDRESMGPIDQLLAQRMVAGSGPDLARQLHQMAMGRGDGTAPDYWSDRALAPRGPLTVPDRARDDLRRMAALQFLAEDRREEEISELQRGAKIAVAEERSRWERGWPRKDVKAPPPHALWP